ncbi:MAG: ABC transporter permease [Acidimicrobiia bacterium]|nr:ABC transporter permease [Acidimicrobiia bacterium]
MNKRIHAVRVGLNRGWIEFKQSVKSPQDQGFYLFMGGGALLYLFLSRNSVVEGTSLLRPTVVLPSLLGALIAFGVVVGPAYSLAMEREDGTLLRAKAAPNGVVGYVAGQILYQSLGLLPMMAVILIPSFFLFEGLMGGGASGWWTMVWVTVLGLLAALPIGIVVGSLVKSAQKVGTWGMTPIMGLAGISGIFYPVQALWDWLQVVAQIFPMYWIALGMRSAFLPSEAATFEIGGSWRTLETVGVLATWAVLGFLVAPVVLRRMARRQSGSEVEANRDAAAQWVR